MGSFTETYHVQPSFGWAQTPNDLIQKIEKTMKKTHAITQREPTMVSITPRSCQSPPPPPRPSLKEFFVAIPDVTYVLREI